MQAMAHHLSSSVSQCDVIHLVIYYLITLLMADSSRMRYQELGLSDITDSFFLLSQQTRCLMKCFQKHATLRASVGQPHSTLYSERRVHLCHF